MRSKGPSRSARTTGRQAGGLTLCTIRRRGGFTLGVRTPRGVLDVERSARALRLRAPRDVHEVIEGEDLPALRRLLAAAETSKRAVFLREDRVPFGPCVTRPEKIVMMGFNYRRHCLEAKAPIPAQPVFFNKYNNALLGHGGTVPLPVKVADQFDYEAELVVVVGKTARDVSPANALSHVFGYCTGNDFSARDLQFKTSQFMLGKCCDGFAPIGPWLVGAELVADPQDLAIECRVNGELRQSSSTSDMIFGCAELVSYASRHMTLKPGDLIFTGTPEGVILGRPEAERVWLKPGDRISTAVGNLGELRFTLA